MCVNGHVTCVFLDASPEPTTDLGTSGMMHAYWLTDIDEINPLGIEIWCRTTRHFSILNGIEAIRSVPKKYQTRYPALNKILVVVLWYRGPCCETMWFQTGSLTSYVPS